MRWWLTVVLLLSHAAVWAQATASHTIDLQPYGFRPTRNEDYRPHWGSSEVHYLADGSLLISFHSRVMIAGAHDPISRLLQPIELLHVDAKTGKVLAHTREMASAYVQDLWPRKNGFLLFAGDQLRIFDNDLKLERGFRVPDGVTAVGVAPTANALAVFLRSEEQTQEVHMLDLSSFAERESYAIVNGSNPVFMRNGYAVVAHDRGGNRELKLVNGGLVKRIALPRLPCRSLLEAVSPEAVAVSTCDQFTVFGEDGNKILDWRLGGDEGDGIMFLAAQAPRFGVATIAGFSGYPRDQQRVYGKAFHISIYDLKQGKKIFSIKVSPMPKIGGAFALSPDGKHLAILKDGAVEQVEIP